ncbi:MAG: hypothetical protein QM496_14835 [Verrucomicrobiota bacterium]
MKTFIQISILLLAILLGILWQTFRTEIYVFLEMPETVTVNNPQSPETNQANLQQIPRLTKKPEPAHSRNNAPDSPPISQGLRTKDSASLDQDTQIESIVLRRYPDIVKIPFAEKYPDLALLPPAALPERIQIQQDLNFKLKREGKIVGISVVKAGGFVRPRQIKMDHIIVSSLANKQMTESLLLSQTNFINSAKNNYGSSLERAIIRLEKMREADRIELRRNPDLCKNLIAEKKVWYNPDNKQFDYVKSEISQLLAGRSFNPIAFYANGDTKIEGNKTYSGVYYVIIVLLEGRDTGFGPYPWTVRCLLRNGQIVTWIGLPEKPESVDL